ncbi:Reverse transcriptase, partial [Phytophthora palmivora]
MWLSGDRIPRIPGYVSVGSRRYAEWQNLAYQATTDEISEAGTNEQITEPMVERPEYVTPTAILPRPVKAIHNVKIAGNGDASPPSIECTSDQGKIDPANGNNLRTKVAADIGDPTMDDEVYVEDQMAVLPDITATTEEVKIEDLQIGDANTNTQEEIERLHLLIGKGNALPPAAKGVVCDIDVGNAKPVAQRCRKVATLSQGDESIKSVIVIIKKNGIDIRLCIDYRLVNCLTRLMVYPMPLINDLLDDLDKILWYCSLDMASGFWTSSAFTSRANHFAGSPNFSIPETGEPDLERNESVLGRRSYIDDILVTGRSWDALCEKVKSCWVPVTSGICPSASPKASGVGK